MTAPYHSHSALIRREERAWDALVRRFTPTLRSVARDYRLAPHEVEDVVQASWLALLESLHRVREPDAVGAWLTTTARRQSLRTRRRRERDVLVEALHDETASGDATPTAASEAERAGALHAALRRLPARQRALLEALIARPELSHAELARHVDMPVGSIGPTRARGLAHLRFDTRLVRAVAA